MNFFQEFAYAFTMNFNEYSRIFKGFLNEF